MNAQNGSDDEFERLALPLFDSLYNFARWLTHDATEAEDLVQEVYVKALKGFSSFESGTDFRAWVFRILRNTFLTSRTGLRARLTVPLELEDQETVAVTWETPESLVVASGTRQTIQDALERLPLSYREVILLCEVEEMKYQQISEILAVPIGTVMSRLSRARKILREMLAGERTARSTPAGK